MKKTVKHLMLAFVAFFLVVGTAVANPIHDVGSPLIMIDGNGDLNTTVDILTTTTNYDAGYFLNYDYTNFMSLALFNEFNGGDIVDLALFDGNRYYTLSGDASDDSYSVTMHFSSSIAITEAQMPTQSELFAMGINTYYGTVDIDWNLTSAANAGEIVFAYKDNNDGVAPVPEPGTLILLGSGLAGVGFYTRRKKS